MKNQSSIYEKKQSTQKGALLSSRLLNSLPYTESVKDYYIRTKKRNEVLRIGFNLAETCASYASSPFLAKYKTLDKFAGAALDKIEERYGDNLLEKSVTAVTYPIGFSVGLATFARDKMRTLASPAVEMTTEWADVLVDGLLPPDSDDTFEDEYRRFKHMPLKSPISKIREHTNLSTVIRMPANAYTLSRNLFSSSAYMAVGFTTMSSERLMNSISVLLGSINTMFAEFIEHPWTVINNTDFWKLYHAMVFNGVRFVNKYINELEASAWELSDYLENRHLPYNSQVVGYVAQKIRSIERRLVRVGGIISESNTTIEISLTRKASLKAAEPEKAAEPVHRPRVLMRSTSNKRRLSPDDRILLNGEFDEAASAPEEPVASSSAAPVASASTAPVASSSGYETPIASLFEKREDSSSAQQHETIKGKSWARVAVEGQKKAVKKAKAKAHPKVHISVGKPGVFEEEIKPTETLSEPVDPSADAHGFIPVKAKAHDHLIPSSVAKEIGTELLAHPKKVPITPTNTPISENNPYETIQPEDKIVPGPLRNINEKEVKAMFDKTLSQMLKKVQKELAHDEAMQRAERHAELPAWQSAKHAVHIHHEKSTESHAAENNPFAKLEETPQDPLAIGMSSM